MAMEGTLCGHGGDTVWPWRGHGQRAQAAEGVPDEGDNRDARARRPPRHDARNLAGTMRTRTGVGAHVARTVHTAAARTQTHPGARTSPATAAPQRATPRGVSRTPHAACAAVDMSTATSPPPAPPSSARFSR